MERFEIKVREAQVMPGQYLPFLGVPADVVQALAVFGLITKFKEGVYLLTARGYEAAWNAPDVIEMADGEAVLCG
jgi:hypothetical protein